jgi:hypothetical protein
MRKMTICDFHLSVVTVPTQTEIESDGTLEFDQSKSLRGRHQTPSGDWRSVRRYQNACLYRIFIFFTSTLRAQMNPIGFWKAVQKTVVLNSGGSWIVPPDWRSSNSTIECFGGGNGAAGVIVIKYYAR